MANNGEKVIEKSVTTGGSLSDIGINAAKKLMRTAIPDEEEE